MATAVDFEIFKPTYNKAWLTNQVGSLFQQLLTLLYNGSIYQTCFMATTVDFEIFKPTYNKVWLTNQVGSLFQQLLTLLYNGSIYQLARPVLWLLL